MKKLDLKLTSLTALLALSLSACETAPKLSPHFLDTQGRMMREYEVVNPDHLTFKFKQVHPMEWGKDTYGNGFICIPPEEFSEWRLYYLKYKQKNQSN